MDDEDEYEDWDLPVSSGWTADSIARLAAHEAAALASQTGEEIEQDAQITEWLQGQVDIFVQKRAELGTQRARVAVTAYLKGELQEAEPMMSERHLAFCLIEENLDHIEGESSGARVARAKRLVEIAASLNRLDAVIEEGEDLCARSREDAAVTHSATSAA